MQTLKICREINKTLTQKQKIIVLFKVLEMLASDGEFGKKRMEVISTVADAFNIDKAEYSEIESFARGRTLLRLWIVKTSSYLMNQDLPKVVRNASSTQDFLMVKLFLFTSRAWICILQSTREMMRFS